MQFELFGYSFSIEKGPVDPINWSRGKKRSLGEHVDAILEETNQPHTLIQRIRVVRNLLSLSLKDSKDLVEDVFTLKGKGPIA
ncbi:MAG: hypothetical protein A2W25_11660 [candidate division Zixibacteria bacterium RBG_16_53_22]|nr:MAG: hypothetical protein A2W25_11660 [candidate division Zixibacteria bacterium RBG_16_53_22]